MLTESGRIVAIEGRVAWVETLRQSTCGSCAARSGCGHGLLNSARSSSSRGIIKALLPEGGQHFALHDTVQLALPERSFLSAASLLYALPIGTTVLAALAGESWLLAEGMSQARQDLLVTLAAVAGLLAGLFFVRWRSVASAGNPAFQPRITARL